MAKVTPDPKARQIVELHKEVVKLQKQLDDIPLTVRVRKTDAHFSRIRTRGSSDVIALGKYLLLLGITARKQTLYIPLSIASGRKSAGFIYQIEGTTTATAVTTIETKGREAPIVTSGTITYCKIEPGKTVTFKILSEVTGSEKQTYQIVLSRINYKITLNDLRYKRFLTEIKSQMLTFK